MTDDPDKVEIGTATRKWWHDLNGTDTMRSRDRAAFADLRRISDPVDLLFAAGFRPLRVALHAHAGWQLRRAAIIAQVLAHVREDDSRFVARALGPVRDDQEAAMSEARFRRLLQARDDEDLTRRLVRAVRMLKGKAHVGDLANSIWYWNDRTRQNWAFHYLNAELPGSAPLGAAPSPSPDKGDVT